MWEDEGDGYEEEHVGGMWLDKGKCGRGRTGMGGAEVGQSRARRGSGHGGAGRGRCRRGSIRQVVTEAGEPGRVSGVPSYVCG